MNKVILVGPSKSLLKSKLGKKIDSYDVVCRMNNGGRPDILNGEHKDIIGTKRSIWLCKHVALLRMFETHGYKKIVGFGNNLTDYQLSSFSESVKMSFIEGKDILEKTINTLKNSVDLNKYNRPSCGILSIFYLLEK